MCDGEPIWTQQGAVAKHVTKERKIQSQPNVSALLRGQKAVVGPLVNSHTSRLL